MAELSTPEPTDGLTKPERDAAEGVARDIIPLLHGLATPEQRRYAVQLLTKIYAPKGRQGAFWQDDERREKIRAAIRAGHARRRGPIVLEWRVSGRREQVDSYEEAGKHVGKPGTYVSSRVSAGKGIAYFPIEDDVITISRQPPAKVAALRLVEDPAV